MKCRIFREKILLRDEELTINELKALERHQNECRVCAAEYRSQQSVRRVVNILQKSEPKLPNPHQLTQMVIDRLHQDQRSARLTATVYELFVEWLATPKVRFACSLLLFIITGSFILEYSSAYIQIKGLETTVAEASFRRESQVTSSLVSDDAAEMISNTAKFIAGKKSYLKVSGDWVMINRSSIEKFILLYGNLQSNTPKLSEEFRTAHPRLAKLLTTRKDSEDLEALLKEREALIQELNDLIPQERK
jgi:hypothetical protein